MKHHESARHETAEDDLQHYLHERPGLLLKMLDIAEACCHESEKPAVGSMLRTADAAAIHQAF